MEATASTLLRPAARRCLTAAATTTSTLFMPATTLSVQQQLRGKATASRHKKALNIPPHPSFLDVDEHGDGDGDTVVFNPPSASPSVYHTPFKFLPKTDPRRRANLASLFERQFSSSLPPPAAAAAAADDVAGMQIVKPKVLHDRPPVNKDEVEEMRALRRSDPHKWTVHNLAMKYDLPHGFIMSCCQAPRDKIDFEKRKLELIQARWGPIRRKAREDRKRRNEMLYRGEI